MPLASLVRDRFLTAIAMGLTDLDWAAIAHISYENAGLRNEVGAESAVRNEPRGIALQKGS